MSEKISLEAPERNKGPILEVLQKVIPEKFGHQSPINVLEIGAGTGQHAVYFSENISNLVWQPTDIEDQYIESIKQYIMESKLTNIQQPFHLDITDLENNKIDILNKKYHMIVSVNLLHIAPWKCSEKLFEFAGKVLTPGGILVTYGPYSLHGEINPESNVKFDQSLKVTKVFCYNKIFSKIIRLLLI